MPKIRPAELLQVGGPVTLAFLWCNSCIGRSTRPSSISRPGREAASAIAVRAAAAPSAGTFTALPGGQAGLAPPLERSEVWLAVHRPLPLDRLNRGMPKQDAAAILGEILSEADALIRLRLKEQGLELPHLVVGATPDNQIVVRSNGDHEVMRSFGEDLKNVADELEAPPEPDDTTH